MHVVAHRVAPPSTTPSTAGSMTGDIIHMPKRTPGTARKQRYKVSHLPLPPGVSQSWKSIFIPPLLAWAGSQENPWGLSDFLRAEVVNIWGRVYPQYPLRETDIHIMVKVVRLPPYHPA